MKLMAPSQANAGLFVGLNMGHIITKTLRGSCLINLPAEKGEVAGFSPYEKRMTEPLKVAKVKRALKVSKPKLGTPKSAWLTFSGKRGQ